MLKAIIFDMDGVLLDSKQAWFTIFNETLQHFEKRSVTIEEFEQNLWANNFTPIVKQYFSVPVEKVRGYFDRLYSEFKDKVLVNDDTRSTLKKLKEKGLKLTVATNTHYSYAERILTSTGLIGFFDLIIGIDMVKNGKPEPDMLLKSLDKLKLKKDEAVYVGDASWDQIASKAADIRFIGFKRNGDERIEKLSDLVKIIS